MSKKTKKNLKKSAGSVNPAKKQGLNSKNKNNKPGMKKPDSTIDKEKTLIKPDPSDREATRAYYEQLSIQKTQRGLKKRNDKLRNKIDRNGFVAQEYKNSNIAVSSYKTFRSGVTKQLNREDYKRFLFGICAFVIIAAMVAVPLVGLFSWYNMGLGMW